MSNGPIDLSSILLSKEKSERRLAQAAEILGEKVICRLMAIVLFLWGADRKVIAKVLGLPLGTLLSLLTRVGKVGLPALEDRRRAHSELLSTAAPAQADIGVRVEEEHIVIGLNTDRSLRIRSASTLQARVVLLTLVNNGILSAQPAADALGCTPDHLRVLCRRLETHGAEGLQDQRRGQTRDYRMTPEVKSELIVQCVAHALAARPTSSPALTAAVNERMRWQLAERTVRLHLRKLGLAQIAKSLLVRVDEAKKNSTPS